MKKYKKIKFVAPSKIILNSKDDFMTKLKPVLGQNQINIVTFINDFNKKTSFLSDSNVIDLKVQIFKNIDKSFSISIDTPSAACLRKQFISKENSLDICKLQDIILLKNKFDNKIKKINLFDNQTTARILLSNFKASKITILNNEK